MERTPAPPAAPAVNPAERALELLATGVHNMVQAQAQANVSAAVAHMQSMVTPFDGSQPHKLTQWAAEVKKAGNV